MLELKVVKTTISKMSLRNKQKAAAAKKIVSAV